MQLMWWYWFSSCAVSSLNTFTSCERKWADHRRYWHKNTLNKHVQKHLNCWSWLYSIYCSIITTVPAPTSICCSPDRRHSFHIVSSFHHIPGLAPVMTGKKFVIHRNTEKPWTKQYMLHENEPKPTTHKVQLFCHSLDTVSHQTHTVASQLVLEQFNLQ